MKTLLIGLLFLLTQQGSAQVVVDSINLNEVPQLEFIQILGYNQGFFKKKLVVIVDYGQRFTWDKDSRVTKDGEVKVFQSMVQALNFFFDNGWDLETSFLLSIEGSGHVYHHLLRRKKH
jgi:hypothetical protein